MMTAVAVIIAVEAIVIYSLWALFFASGDGFAWELLLAVILYMLCSPLAVAGVATTLVGLVMAAVQRSRGQEQQQPQVAQTASNTPLSDEDKAKRIYIVCAIILAIAAIFQLMPALRNITYSNVDDGLWGFVNDMVLVPISGLLPFALMAMLAIPLVGASLVKSNKLKLIGLAQVVIAGCLLMASVI